MLFRSTKLDIGCGNNKHEGFTGIDLSPIPGVDIVHDLDVFPWPIEDDCVEEAIAYHYVEHTKDLIKFMNELYRIMKTGAVATITSPYYNSVRAWQDPTHTRAISEKTFMYFNKAWRQQSNIEHYPIYCDFEPTFEFIFFKNWIDKSPEERIFAIQHYTNVVADVKATLVKRPM
jgi:hypothetical protein